MKKTSLCTLLIFLFTLNCAGHPSETKSVAQSNQASTTEQKKGTHQSSDLRAQIEQIAQTAQGRVGVSAIVIETGESVELNGSEKFPMQSVYKFPIGMAVLNLVDQGKIKLDQKVRVGPNEFVRKGMGSPLRDENPNGGETSVAELLRFGVSLSDGTASDVLLRLAGGAETVSAYLNDLNVTEIKVLNTEKEIGSDNSIQYKNWATPNGAIALLRALHEGRGLSKQSREFLLKLMIEAPTGPKRLKGLLPAGAIVAHKTGSSGTVKGVTAATNDIGIITLPNGRHLAIAVFVSDSPANQTTREEVIAKIARAAWDYWGK